MCNIFSGHIISDKDHKDWGKIIFLSGIHHEKDREIIYKEYGQIKLTAWESNEEFKLDKGFKITHSEGDLTELEKTELLKLVQDWAKDKNPEDLVRQKFITSKDNEYSFSLEHKSMIDKRDGAVLISPELNGFKQEAWNNSTQKAGYDSTQTAGDNSTQTAWYNSTQTAGYNSIQKAGDNSTQTAGLNSIQIQYWYENAEYKTACRIVTKNEANKAYRTDKGIWEEVKE